MGMSNVDHSKFGLMYALELWEHKVRVSVIHTLMILLLCHLVWFIGSKQFWPILFF
jgi:hypothetical protein